MYVLEGCVCVLEHDQYSGIKYFSYFYTDKTTRLSITNYVGCSIVKPFETLSCKSLAWEKHNTKNFYEENEQHRHNKR